jgi:radical SAM superfamily enzyme YgiQ (UPF0313 family)
MVREINIALADLAYLSEDDYIQPLPLNVGYIAAYLKQNLPGIKVELFKDPAKLYQALATEPKSYACLGLSNYAWNFNLNRHFIETVKQHKPEIITIMGGPNIDSGSDAGLRDFFHYFPGLDYYIIGEGEYKFFALMQSIIKNDYQLDQVWPNIPKQIIGFDKQRNDIIRGHKIEVGHCDCQALPSPYLTGLLDEFLDDRHLVPIIETSRGCPYSCAFCCWGNLFNSGMRQFHEQTVLEELNYISFRGKNPKKALYIADSNFGINKRDKKIAQAIKEINAKNGSYKNIYMYFAKNINDDVIEIAETLKDFTDVSLSRQSVNPEVLKIIGRQNISDRQYDRFHARLKQLGVSTFCELIYGLPEESWESFLSGVEKMYEKGLNVAIYPLLLIKGAKINTAEFREKYNIKSVFRIMPRYMGSYGEINSVEYEEVLISHSRLSEADSRKIRLFVFFHVLFYESIFTEMVVFLKEKQINLASFINYILNDRVNWPEIFVDAMADFESDVKNEFVEEKNLKYHVTQQELMEIKKTTVDLNIYHFLKMVSSERQAQCFKHYLFEVMKRYASDHAVSIDTDELSAVINMCFDKMPYFPKIIPQKTLYYFYDLESWIAKAGSVKIASCKSAQQVAYELHLDPTAINDFNKQYQKNNNVELSLYQTRKNMITRQKAPSSAYTYKRTRI